MGEVLCLSRRVKNGWGRHGRRSCISIDSSFHCGQRYHFLLTLGEYLPGALFSLKRKKIYEAELDKIGDIKIKLETLEMNLESAAQNAETFKVMNQGKNAMAGIRVNTDIGKVDDLMDEIKEEMEAAAEISNALAQPVDPLLHDEDDLLAELEQMSAEAALGAPVVKEQAFPTVPSKKLPAIANASKKEAEELAMLEKELEGMMS